MNDTEKSEREEDALRHERNMAQLIAAMNMAHQAVKLPKLGHIKGGDKIDDTLKRFEQHMTTFDIAKTSGRHI